MQTTQFDNVIPCVIMLQCTQCGRYADETSLDTSVRCRFCNGKVMTAMVVHPGGAVLVVCEEEI
jgi:DNA-directed RNA polymerase subunit RPC12/RpoP